MAGRRCLWVTALTLGNLGSCEAHILANRETVIERTVPLAAKLKSVRAQKQLLSRACQAVLEDPWCNKVKFAELLEWLDSAEGIFFTARLCLRGERMRRLTARELTVLFQQATAEEIGEYRRRRDMVSGLGLLADLDWPERENEDPAWWVAIRRAKGIKDPPRRKPKDGPVPWRLHLHQLASSQAAWDWKVVRDMTLYQYQVYQTDVERLRSPGNAGTMEVGPEYARVQEGIRLQGKDYRPETDEEKVVYRDWRRRERLKAAEARVMRQRAEDWAERLVRRLHGQG